MTLDSVLGSNFNKIKHEIMKLSLQIIPVMILTLALSSCIVTKATEKAGEATVGAAVGATTAVL